MIRPCRFVYQLQDRHLQSKIKNVWNGDVLVDDEYKKISPSQNALSTHIKIKHPREKMFLNVAII